ncbi:hypothetical protein BU26DRAFT_607126 [Trematosphaeria pertusa]|uniref:Uncharacterized protein n=1 Tax=Trematosphaeria pertusa TaxID=390896 RepID=A0A6A6I626_9PLEO|nr:uncharacterized protein BU26DRAFT_607126 [Trematosphaeria pertusa]KAF2245811.1 hypothetical protein BU26DRAFT_607126 [Trematosphaeria pertusa]
MASLQEELQDTPFTRKTRRDILQNLWPALFEAEAEYLDWDAYFDYYESQCDHALHQQGRHILVRTHQHIVDIAQQLEEGATRESIKENLKTLFTSPSPPNEDEVLDNSIDLAVRLYLMVNIGANKSTITRGQKLVWASGSLKRFLADYFNEPPVLSNSNVRFEKAFTASNIERIAGIKIVLTDNIADHLRMVDDDDKRVAIFHHASFLKWQTSALFPPGLVDETLRTLALLFPKQAPQTKKWFLSLPPTPLADRQLVACDQLRLDDRQIETYRFWHDRLIILKQAFDESRPARLSQWWHDRRNGYQWYTFWVAVFVLFLTIFFGLVQSIEGALQVYKAYHPTSR